MNRKDVFQGITAKKLDPLKAALKMGRFFMVAWGWPFKRQV